MPSPTITLALIAKDEEKNINRLLDSVDGCFDEIVLVDTGSKDRTKEIAEMRGCEVYDFEWVDDFAKARNFAFSKATKDFIMWLDLDDCLFGRENFIEWKKTSMEFADCFMNTYHYAIKEDGTPIISFMRERVVRRSKNPMWQYPLHEGLVIKSDWRIDFAASWSVKHHRDAQDMAQDKSRNIRILEDLQKTQPLDARLQFYYGKELFESGKPNEAFIEFEKALSTEKLELHDRLLTYQYANYCAQAMGDMIKDEAIQQKHFWYDKAIAMAMDGLKYDSGRAEFYIGAADSYVKKNDIIKARPLYGAAKNCLLPPASNPYSSAIFTHSECYGKAPAIRLAQINFNLGMIDEAEKEAQECFDKYQAAEADQVLTEIKKAKPFFKLENNQEETEDIVFSCPPQQAYPFDEELYETKGMGGSETALIQMAALLKLKTERNVIVFNGRDKELISKSGVIYRSGRDAGEYFSTKRPRTHIAWRHNIKLTNAKTYLWCHDLVTGSVEMINNFDKIMCLSEFHKSYVIGKQGVDSSKIIVTRNGIDPYKFDFERKPKNSNKVVWMSSPDRGLDRAIKVLDKVRETHGNVELHVYYGLENLYKYGLSTLADKLKEMMAERPWVVYHGFTEQSKMYHEVSDAVLWLHPCDFIETFCITALEMLALGIFPVTRRLGALKNTLREAEENGSAILLDHDCITDEEFEAYATATKQALDKQLWAQIQFDVEKHSWDSVSKEWIQFMEL